jgi:hypothetical protein
MDVQVRSSVRQSLQNLPFEVVALVVQDGGARVSGNHLRESAGQSDNGGGPSISPPDRTDRNYSAGPME